MTDNQDSVAPRRHHHGYWFALVLIVTGTLLLFSNFGLVSPAVWSEIIKFWPVLIILLGLEMILGHSFLGRLALIIITLSIAFFVLSGAGLIPLSALQMLPR